MSKSGQHTTLHDIAREVGVSIASVSRALNDKPGVGVELRKRVLAACKKLNYSPSAAARNLSSAKSNTIGAAFQDLTPGWFLDIFRGMLIKGACTNYHIITSVSERPGDEYDVPWRLLEGQRVDALVWLDARVTPPTIEKVKRHGVPLVLIQAATDDPAINSVSIANTDGATQAMRHLLGLGYRQLLIVTGGNSDPVSQQKWLGVDIALREHGITIPEHQILEGHSNGDFAVKALDKFLQDGHKLPEAIFCFNDDMALAVLHRLRALGYRVPDDVALVGFDGTDEAQRAMLTTIDSPLREMGAMAAQLAIDLIEDANETREPQQILLKGTLRVRETCGAHLT